MVFLTSSSIAARILSALCIVIMVLFLLPLVVSLFDNAKSFRYIQSALDIEHMMSTAVRQSIPTKIGGKDMTRWIVVVGIFILSGTFSRASVRFTEKAQYLKFKQNVDQWKADMHLSDNAIILTPLNQKLEQLKTAKKKDREQLLKEFAETKKRLDEMGRDLAFLAIDVADSTGMKEGEERAIVEHDFKEYKRYVERTLTAHGCLKSTWTPDGVMSCFTSVDAAVKAAREVINGLEEFNRNVKSMTRDFMVRCGVNSGFVYFDDSVPLEEISDRVIDIAGHMQKHAKPNSVCVAKPTIEPLNERGGFEPSGQTVDGYEVYEWKKS
ncbi:MAG: adenylate/guanylate cyclase domain-containing protein [Ignavibacteria bacterium]|nr:adenylate/guanylate cyclase domain-containing protein [Ignavibacteria bacterium]